MISVGGVMAKFQLDISELSTKLKIAESEIKATEEKFSGFSSIAGRMQAVGTSMTLGLTLPIVGVGAAALKTSADFEKGMSGVQALIGGTTEDMARMKEQALELGASTAFSASEVSEGMANLASAGFKVNEVLDAMPGLLDLAASSGTDLATASEIAASTLNGFGLAATDAQRVADVFARAAADTNAGVTDMGEAMKYIAPVSKAAGISLEETAAAIGLLSNAGIKGSQAGTTLRSAMLSLAKPTDAAQTAMDGMSFSAYDSEGKMKSLKDIVGQLGTSMQGMTDQQKQSTLTTIFGTEAMSGMLTLVGNGPDAMGKLTKSFENSDGAAAEMAKTMQDNLAGSVDQMKGAFETLGISIGDIMAPMVRKLADAISALVQKFNGLSDEQKKIIIIVAGVVAAIGPAILIFTTLMLAIEKVRKAFLIFKAAMSVVGVMGPWMIAIIAIAAAAFLIYKNWDKITLFFSNLFRDVANNFNAFKLKFIMDWENLKAGVMAKINGLKQGFLDFVAGMKNNFNNAINGVRTAFTNFVTNIRTNVSNVLNTIKGFISGIFNNIADRFMFVTVRLKAIWNTWIFVFKHVWEVIKLVFLGAILLIIDLFTGNFTKLKEDSAKIWNNIKMQFEIIWFGIKQIFSIALDTISIAFTLTWNAIKAFFFSTLNNIITNVTNFATSIVNWFTTTWANIVTNTTNAWTNLKTTVTNLVTNTKDNIVNTFNNLVNWLKGLPATLMTIGSNMFTSMRTGVVNTITGVQSAITNGIDNAVAKIKALPGEAFTWGKDFVQGLINGIKNMIGGIADAATSIASKIRNILHFSVPDEGPLTDYETWMPDFMEGLAKGIKNNKHMVATAINSLASDMNIGMNIKASGNGSGGTSKSVTNTIGTLLHAENVNIRDDSDIDKLAKQLAFYIKQNNLALGVK